jgi:phenylalanyl-tRNA synthetase beta chain
VEEIMRIDGFDNIEIPTRISITPATSTHNNDAVLREKTASLLTGMGFNEMLNNSITNSKNYTEEELKISVRMLNNLSSELDMLRYSMMETGLETIARNIHHRNENVKLFEFGKTYHRSENNYVEEDHLALFATGVLHPTTWNSKETNADLYFLKGVIESLELQAGIQGIQYNVLQHPKFDAAIEGTFNKKRIALIAKPSEALLKHFDIKTPVWYADIAWKTWLEAASSHSIRYKEISKFPPVQRDLSFVASEHLAYAEIEKVLTSLQIPQLKSYRLFDIFKSEKLGKEKQSMAMNFTFLDETKTMKDEEIEKMMNKITTHLEKHLQAEVRK